MNLQPMNPRPAAGLRVFCVKCRMPHEASTTLADLDGKPGDYYCPACVEKMDDK